MRNRPFITLDSNIIIGYFPDGKSPVEKEDVEKLLKHHKNGNCTIFLTTRIHSDVQKDPWKKKIAKLCEEYAIDIIPATGRFGFSRYGEDIYGSEQDVQLSENIKNILFPNTSPKSLKENNRLSDVDHLVAHFKAGHDFFVTADGGILNKSNFLSSKGIQVKTLEKILEILQR